jgi:hypothetical protein
VDDVRDEVDKSERVKQSKSVRKYYLHAVQCEWQKHPLKSACGSYGSCNTCDMNSNFHEKVKHYIKVFKFILQK